MGEVVIPRVPSLHPAQTFRWVTLGLVAGFAASVVVRLPWQMCVLAVALVVTFILLQRQLRAVGLLTLGCLLALLRTSFLTSPPPPSFFVGPQQFEAKIVEEPKVSERSRRYVVQPEASAVGQVVLVTLPYPGYRYGDRLRVSCKNVEVVDFAGYTNQGVWRQCTFPDLELVARSGWSLRGSLLELKYGVGAYMQNLLNEPYAALAAGMLWGDYSKLPQSTIDAFRRTGTSHLLAVSGYNVMVLSEILFTVLIAVGLWRKQASWVVVGVLILFTLFTGAEASVVRAAIMASLLIAARLLARKPDRVNVLLGTAAAMLLFGPRLVLDLGFQLSFGAMAGLMFVAPVFEQQFSLLPEVWGLRQSVAQTMAATVVTLPIILVRLDQLSLVSPFANVLLGPVVVLVFALGLPLLVLGMVQWLAAPLAWALTAVLYYVITVVESLASLPWAWTQGSAVAWIAVVMLYAVGAWWLWPRPEGAKK